MNLFLDLVFYGAGLLALVLLVATLCQVARWLAGRAPALPPVEGEALGVRVDGYPHCDCSDCEARWLAGVVDGVGQVHEPPDLNAPTALRTVDQGDSASLTPAQWDTVVRCDLTLVCPVCRRALRKGNPALVSHVLCEGCNGSEHARLDAYFAQREGLPRG